MQMHVKEVDAMKRRVIKYYDEHLSPHSFIKKAESATSSELEVFMQTGTGDYLSRVNKNSVIICDSCVTDARG